MGLLRSSKLSTTFVWAVAVAMLWAAPLVLPLIGSQVRLVLRPELGPSLVLETERPLTIRSLAGAWSVVAIAGWFLLANRTRNVCWWEPLLIVLTAGASLVRLGNVWLLALGLVPAVARQIELAQLTIPLRRAASLALVSLCVFVFSNTRPPALPEGATHAAVEAGTEGAVMAFQAWTNPLQSTLHQQQVLGAGDAASLSEEYWIDYARVSDGHESWATILDRDGVMLLVLNLAAQPHAAVLVRASSQWQVLFDGDSALVARRLDE